MKSYMSKYLAEPTEDVLISYINQKKITLDEYVNYVGGVLSEEVFRCIDNPNEWLIVSPKQLLLLSVVNKPTIAEREAIHYQILQGYITEEDIAIVESVCGHSCIVDVKL